MKGKGLPWGYYIIDIKIYFKKHKQKTKTQTHKTKSASNDNMFIKISSSSKTAKMQQCFLLLFFFCLIFGFEGYNPDYLDQYVIAFFSIYH